jgi:hypothetical protein
MLNMEGRLLSAEVVRKKGLALLREPSLVENGTESTDTKIGQCSCRSKGAESFHSSSL